MFARLLARVPVCAFVCLLVSVVCVCCLAVLSVCLFVYMLAGVFVCEFGRLVVWSFVCAVCLFVGLCWLIACSFAWLAEHAVCAVARLGGLFVRLFVCVFVCGSVCLFVCVVCVCNLRGLFLW